MSGRRRSRSPDNTMLTCSAEMNALSAAVANAAAEAIAKREKIILENPSLAKGIENRNRLVEWLEETGGASVAACRDHFGWKNCTTRSYLDTLTREGRVFFTNQRAVRVYRATEAV